MQLVILMLCHDITKLLVIFPTNSLCIFIRLCRGDLENGHQPDKENPEKARGLVEMPFPNAAAAQILSSSPVLAQIPVHLPIPVKIKPDSHSSRQALLQATDPLRALILVETIYISVHIRHDTRTQCSFYG